MNILATAPYLRIKRFADCLITIIATPIILPIVVLVGLAVRATLGSPVLFRQMRPGRDGVPFEMLKFRTMRSIDVEARRVTNEQRMTKFGSVLRSSSLDELPSLLNVLKGDMSLVGPRPLRMSYIPRYTKQQLSRHSVRPGLTGLAQVSGRNALTWDDRLELDVKYVNSMGPKLDLMILAKTAQKVVRREGVAATGQATMSEFFGPERTSDLTIRPLEAADLPVRVRWLRDPEIRAGITITYWPSEEAMKCWFASAELDTSRRDYTAIDRSTGHPEAMCGLTAIDGGAANLYIYVNPDRQRRGYGTQTMQMLIAKARQLQIEDLILETQTNNYRARRMYERLGFAIDASRSTTSKHVMCLKLEGHNQPLEPSAGRLA